MRCANDGYNNCPMLFTSYRITTEYRLLAGLWYGSSKPDMSLFLKPMAKTLQRMYDDGEHIPA